MSRGKKILEELRKLNESTSSGNENKRLEIRGTENKTNFEVDNPLNLACEDGSQNGSKKNSTESKPNIVILQNLVLQEKLATKGGCLVYNSIDNITPKNSPNNSRNNRDHEVVDVIVKNEVNKCDSDIISTSTVSENSDLNLDTEYVPDNEELNSDSDNSLYYGKSSTYGCSISKSFNRNSLLYTENSNNFEILSNVPLVRTHTEIDLIDKKSSEFETNVVTTNATNSVSNITFSEMSETVLLDKTNILTEHKIEDRNSTDKQSRKNKTWTKVKRLPDYCYYCETSVLNFARHLLRSHSHELEVQRILHLKPNDITRKRLIAAIRKRGNHLTNLDTCIKPVKKSHVPGRNESECVPCKHCLGYFRPEQLWRHVKGCPQNPGEKTKFSHKSDGQNVLIRCLAIDRKLKETVFPRMLADKISLIAKKDALICNYGAQYLASHREKHHVNVCSRKMRELAKILIEIQKMHPTIRNFYDALQPVYFDSFVEAVKIIAGYDSNKEVYTSSTFAMNIATSLKECCSLAIRMTLKKSSCISTVDTASLEANFKTFQQLLIDSWKFEVSSVAASCLNTRKWNKITIVPLASDIKIFRAYLSDRAKLSLEELKINAQNEKAYKCLLEVTYCRSMLLNRKRGGELQRMPLHLYQNAPMHQSYEEFHDSISHTEKILLKRFKRVVTRGKRDRGVPVLFSPDVQQHLQVLLELRNSFVKKSNNYLFPTLHHDSPITGYKVMQKHANLSGAKCPEAITSTKLRKHLATMSQILELSPNDVEQLATFMGHTKDIHKQVYRLPDDVFQTAKIAKLLLLMESGKAVEYKGKSLDEIELDLGEYIYEDTSDEELNEDTLHQQHPCTSSAASKKKRKLIPWNTQQKNLAKLYFQEHIKKKMAPKKRECDSLKLRHLGIFDNKTWPQIKVFIQNIYRLARNNATVGILRKP